MSVWSTKEWLKGFGLEQYYTCFIENGYETRKLCANLKNEDLDGMGITNTLHRNIFVNQSERLRTAVDKRSCGSESPGNSPAVRHSSGKSPKKRTSSTTLPLPSTDESTDTNTYTTVFDDTKVKKRGLFSSSPKQPQKKNDTNKVHSMKPKKNTNKKASASRFMSTAAQLVLDSQSPQSMTKLQLKLHIKDMLARDQIILSDMKYITEDGTPNEIALIQLAENYADELNLEGLNVYDALKDIWRYVANEKSEYVLSKSTSSTPSTASSPSMFSYSALREESTYSEPFDSSTKPSTKLHSKMVSNDKPVSAILDIVPNPLSSNYADPFDAIPVTNQPVFVKTSPVNKSKVIQLSSTAIKSNEKFYKGIEGKTSNTLPPPSSPNLSAHSSSSDDGPFPQTPKQKDVALPGIKDREKLTSSMEDLNKPSVKESRHSLSPHQFNLPRSVSSNPSMLYQKSVELESKKNIGGSLDSLNKIQPNLPVLNPQPERFNEHLPHSVKVMSRVKGLTVANNKEDFELSNMLEVYVEGNDKPIKFFKAKDIEENKLMDIKEEKKKSSLFRRFFYKKINKSKTISTEHSNNSEIDGKTSKQNSTLTNSTSLPDITAVASIHSEYAEVFDGIPTNNQTSPPILPLRNPMRSSHTTGRAPKSSSLLPVTHHKLMIKPNPNNKVIHSSSALLNDESNIIEINTPTAEFIDAIPKTNIHGVIHKPEQQETVKESSDQLTAEAALSSSGQSIFIKELSEDVIQKFTPNQYDDPWKPIIRPIPKACKSKLSWSSEHIEETNSKPVSATPPSQNSSPNQSADSSPSHFELKSVVQKPARSKTQSSKSKTSASHGTSQISENSSPHYQDIDSVFTNLQSTSTMHTEKVNKSTDQLCMTEEKEKDTVSNSNMSYKKVTTSKPPLSSNLLQIALEKKCIDENIDLTAPPYSSQRGEYGIPSALVSRYSEEIGNDEEEVARTLDKVRRSSLLKCRRSHIPLKKDWKKFCNIKTSSMEAFLISIGLSHCHDLVVQLGYTSVLMLKEANLDLLPLEDTYKSRLIAFAKKL